MQRLLIVAFLLLAGCAATTDILSEFDESKDFDDYKTFVLCVDDFFVENTKFPKYDNEFIRESIANEIEDHMILKGYKTNVFKPQLQAGFRLVVEENEVTFTECESQQDYSYWRECTIKTETYTDETLILYVSEIDTRQIVWQASIPVDFNKPKSALEKEIRVAVEKLFNEYPNS
jgi:hypothetical protein